MTKEEWKEKIEKEGLDSLTQTDSFEWGSIQYETAAGMFGLVQTMKETLSFIEILEVLDTDLKMGQIIPFKVSKINIIKDALDSIYKSGEDISSIELQLQRIKMIINRADFNEIKISSEEARDILPNSSYAFYQLEFVSDICDAKNGDELVVCFREAAHDLWSAIPTICNSIFEGGIEFKNKLESPGYGPVMNVEMQKQNYNIGLLCALLYEYKIVKDPENSFNNFDT